MSAAPATGQSTGSRNLICVSLDQFWYVAIRLILRCDSFSFLAEFLKSGISAQRITQIGSSLKSAGVTGAGP